MKPKKQPYKKTSRTCISTFSAFLNKLYNYLENFRTYLLTQPFFLIVTRWQKPSFAKRYTMAIVIVIAVSLCRIFLNVFLEQNLTYIIFTFAVVISAWYGGFGTGLFATVLSLISAMFLSPDPASAITITNGPEQIRIVLFILQGSIISLLSETVQDATRWQSLILESISDVFITYDRNMRFVYVNKRAEEMLHSSKRQLLGRRLLDVYPQVKKTVLFKYCREALRTQKKKQFEMYVPEDGKWFDVSLYPSQDGISTYYQDITKRKSVERRLRESQLQFRRFMDANIIGVVIEDLNGTLYEANDAFLSMIGYTRADLDKGLINWKEITPPEYDKLDNEVNERLIKKGMVHPYIKEYVRKDGRRIHVMLGAVLLRKTSQKAITFYLDVTEQHELDKKKNEFISIASHELKTPLTSVKAFTQILMRQFQKTNDKRSLYFLTSINSQLDKLNDLVSELLDVSKIEEGRLTMKKDVFSLDALVSKTVVDFHYITTSHTITKEGASKQLVKGDEHRIGQVLINLISNAIKYSPKGDRIIVSIKDDKKYILISVRDFGEGIPEEDRERIFTRFYRSRVHEDSRISGFGLGLYISREIIVGHKGEITVTSEEGKGSVFTVKLPAMREVRKKIPSSLRL